MIIVRYSEIGLKGVRARKMMEKRLRSNIAAGLARVGETVSFKWERGRLFVDGYGSEEKVRDVLGRTMGVKSFSVATDMKFNSPADVVEKAVSLYSQKVSGKKFAVRSRRAGGQNFNTVNLNVMVGDSLYAYSKGVDLENPDIEINIELRNDTAYFYTESIPGPGGLPIGSEGGLVALVSGGIDSPVAAWMMLKRGSPLDFVFVSLAHPVDTLDFLQSVKVLRDRWMHGYDPVIHIIDGQILVDQLVAHDEYLAPSVTFKRILYLVSQHICRDSGYFGIVTGESLGQVSSQTPENLMAINSGIDIPVYRPLIGMDKDDISQVARKIGTFPVSSKGEFCSLFSKSTVMGVTRDQVNHDMGRFDFLDDLLKRDTIIRGSGLDEYAKTLSAKDFAATKLTDNAIVVDLRGEEKYAEWHVPGSIHSSLAGVRVLIETHGKNKPYIFYCQKGLQSAYAASEARKMGALAYYMDTEKARTLSNGSLAKEH